jgi:hypothetical protein
MKMFLTKENGVLFVTVLAAVMAGLAVHQVVVAPRLAPKK